MAETGEFQAVSFEDLESYVHSNDRDMTHRDLANLEKQKLIKRHRSRYPDHVQVITLTSQGKSFLQKAIGGGREFYSGLNSELVRLWSSDNYFDGNTTKVDAEYLEVIATRGGIATGGRTGRPEFTA